MSLKTILKALTRAAPVILANAPAVIAAVRQVKRAARGRPDPAGQPQGQSASKTAPPSR